MECFEITALLSALGAEICNVVSAVFRASSILTTVRPEIYSNDFGRFGNSSADSNSNFVVVDILSKSKIHIFCVFGVHAHMFYEELKR